MIISDNHFVRFKTTMSNMKQVSCYTIHLSVYINYQHILVTDILRSLAFKNDNQLLWAKHLCFLYIAAGYKNYSTFYGNDSCRYLHWFR